MVHDHSLRTSAADTKAGQKTVPIQWSKEEHFVLRVTSPIHKKAPVAHHDRTLKSNSSHNVRFSP
ncbi:MAG: hypothetical protein JWR26_329 [Pedosphaera sp.]|nr:hypothetical protein [Pedosphaera sp.]